MDRGAPMILHNLRSWIPIGVILMLLSSCILPSTAECDKNNACPSGQLCYRKFCRQSCTTALEPRDSQLEECGVPNELRATSTIICRECDGECAGDDGQVCVDSTVCEPVCECEECCVNGTCVDP